MHILTKGGKATLIPSIYFLPRNELDDKIKLTYQSRKGYMELKGLHEREIFYEKYPFRLAINQLENFEYPLHWHNAVEFLYVMQNDFSAIVNNNQYILNSSDILIIAPGAIHGFNGKHNNGKRVFLQFDVAMLDGFGDIKQIMPYLYNTKLISASNHSELNKDLITQILKIIDAYEKKDFASSLYINARIFDMLVMVGKYFKNQLIDSQSGNMMLETVKKTEGLKRINAAFEYINTCNVEQLNLKAVSNAIGFSEFHFSRIFKEITNKHFQTYLNEFKVRNAEKLLIEGDCSMMQIAERAGFNSIATFNRAFKEIKGCSPSAFKKMKV